MNALHTNFWCCTGSALHTGTVEQVPRGQKCWCGAREMTPQEKALVQAYLESGTPAARPVEVTPTRLGDPHRRLQPRGYSRARAA